MRGWALRLSAVVLSVWMFGSMVSAQAPADESMDTEAHALFEAGRTAFAAGRFTDALSHFQSVYDLSHRAVLLYNIGQCHDRLRHDAEALAAFEGYLAAVPDSAQRGEVESRIAILREATASASESATESESASESESESESASPSESESAPPPVVVDNGPGAAPWIVLGVGAAIAIAGAVLVGVAFGDISTVENAPADSMFSSVQGAYDQAPILSGIGWAALGVGAAMAIAGVAWGVAGSSGGSGEHAALRITPGGLALTGAF